ncbi:MAG: hypothetical protein PQJ59_06165 [Spirochaetales bacterium]|nr:hypothetical protein [Spirochaetales bacterium]
MIIFPKKTLFIGAILLVASTLSALPSLTDFLSDEQRAQLNGTGEITQFHFEDTTPALMPQVSQTATLEKQLAELEGNFSIEGIFFVPDRSEASNEDKILEILNILSRVSRLEGLQYYSASREEMRLLFEECWRIEDEDSDAPLEDLQFTSLPDKTTFHIHQKDLTFGANKMSVDITTAEDCLFMAMQNTTRMKYNGLIRVINKEKFHTDVLVIPVEEGILYYGSMTAKTMNIGVLKNKASKSFYNRMKALFYWFSDEYENR